MEGLKTPIKPFTKTLGKRKSKESTSSASTSNVKISKVDTGSGSSGIEGGITTTTNTAADDKDDDDEGDDQGDGGHDESNENNNIKELKETPSVSLNTILRWKEKKRVDVDCFLGFSDHSSEADKITGTEILHNLGHFYCIWCQCYIRANKKSAQRHQTRNKKHILRANEELGNGNMGGTHQSHHNLMNAPIYDQQSQSSILSHAYLAATKNSDNRDGSSSNNMSNNMLSPAPEAWTIISNPRKVQDTEKLQDILTTLGICDAHDLMLCEPKEILDIISTLKPVGQRRMKQLYHVITGGNSTGSGGSENELMIMNSGSSGISSHSLSHQSPGLHIMTSSSHHNMNSNQHSHNQSQQQHGSHSTHIVNHNLNSLSSPNNNNNDNTSHHGIIQTPNSSSNNHNASILQFSPPTATSVNASNNHHTATTVPEYSPLSSSSSSSSSSS